MKLFMNVLFLSTLLANLAHADERSFPMNGTYVVKAASKIGIQCRSLSSFDSLGQLNTTMKVTSDERGVFIFNTNDGRIMVQLLVSDGYQYSTDHQSISKGRSTFLVTENQTFIVDGGKRLPSDIGFGPIHCEFPKSGESL